MRLIHIDPTEHRKPLPLVELANLEALIQPTLEQIEPENGSVATFSANIKVKLYSDSAHLRQFFAHNWGKTLTSNETSLGDVCVVALRSDLVDGAPEILPGRRYVDPERRIIVSVGSEYYGNVKVSVRGLCSSLVRRKNCGGFLHGASMNVDGAGIVVCGTSGAGKTTATRALMDFYPDGIRIINDDWGWADHETATIAFTGEPRIHMKYRSVRAIAPHLRPSPACYLSENFEGNEEDPHARLLIRREEVFESGVSDSSSFDGLIVILRDESKAFFTRPMEVSDLDLLEIAEYSAFYDRHERFMDGSLLLVDQADLDSERHRFRLLLENIPAVLVNNVASPRRIAQELQLQLDRLGVL